MVRHLPASLLQRTGPAGPAARGPVPAAWPVGPARPADYPHLPAAPAETWPAAHDQRRAVAPGQAHARPATAAAPVLVR